MQHSHTGATGCWHVKAPGACEIVSVKRLSVMQREGEGNTQEYRQARYASAVAVGGRGTSACHQTTDHHAVRTLHQRNFSSDHHIGEDIPLHVPLNHRW